MGTLLASHHINMFWWIKYIFFSASASCVHPYYLQSTTLGNGMFWGNKEDSKEVTSTEDDAPLEPPTSLQDGDAELLYGYWNFLRETETTTTIKPSWYNYIYSDDWYATRKMSVDELAEKDIPFCTEKKTFLCPNLKDKFQTKVCCDSHWIAKGASLNTGDECMIDLSEMERQCEIRTCYKSLESVFPGKWNTDGCTFSPDYFHSYEACVLHDLCYVTPGTTKRGCDDAMEDNINKIYCDNLNYKDSYPCAIRSKASN